MKFLHTLRYGVKLGFRATFWTIPCLILIVLLTGCAGHSFNYAAQSNLELGKTQFSDYKKIIGSHPVRIEHKMNSDGKFDLVEYVYAGAGLTTAKARVLILEFKNGTLNAYIHVSSFSEGKSSLPMDKAYQLKIGKSTKNDVINSLGQPDGKAIYPTTLADFKDKYSKCVEAWVWQSLGKTYVFENGKQPESSSVFVGFDTNGIVDDIEGTSDSDQN